MTRSTGTLAIVREDEPTDAKPSELIVTLRLRLGSDASDPDAARLMMLLERLAEGGEAPPAARFDDDPAVLHVFPESRSVRRGCEEINLTRREFDLLLCLADNPRRAFTRAQLLGQVWDTQYTGQRSVDVHVTRLRNKIGIGVPVVSTVRGVGYRLHTDARVRVVREG